MVRVILNLENSVAFLEHLYPGYDWKVFLPKNLYGLTPEAAPIGFDWIDLEQVCDAEELVELAKTIAGDALPDDKARARAEDFLALIRSDAEKLGVWFSLPKSAFQYSTVVNSRDIGAPVEEGDSQEDLESTIKSFCEVSGALRAIAITLENALKHDDIARSEVMALAGLAAEHAQVAWNGVRNLAEKSSAMAEDEEVPEVNDQEIETLMNALLEAK